MKNRGKSFYVGTIMFLALLLSTGLLSDASMAKTKKSKKVTIKKVSVSAPSGAIACIAKGKKIKLITTVNAKPSSKKNQKVTLKVANKKIANIKKGFVVAKKVGKTKITVKSKVNPKKKATIKVIVKKGAVKKLTMNKKNATLNVGATLNLIAEVSATKKASKILLWHSSNMAVATINNKGVVKAVTPGTVTITAESTDGTNKKTTCKIVVQDNKNINNDTNNDANNDANNAANNHTNKDINNAINITDVTSLGNDILRIWLSKPVPLQKEDIEIYTKKTLKGQYNIKCEVLQIVNNRNNILYDVHIKNEMKKNSYTISSAIVDGCYCKVSISKLNGKNTFEFRKNKNGQNIYAWSGEVGKAISEKLYFDESVSGYLKDVKFTDLPAGLTYEYYQDSAYAEVKGAPMQVANGQHAVLSGTDEDGVNHKVEVCFYIGDNNQIVAYSKSPTVICSSADGVSNFLHAYIYGTGGSGKYTMTLGDVPISIRPYLTVYNYDSSSELYFYTAISSWNEKENKYDWMYLEPGKYSIPVTLTDENGLSADYVYNLTVEKGVKITGFTKGGDGKALEGININVSFDTCCGKYSSIFAQSSTSADVSNGRQPGEYVMYVYPNKTYNMSAYYDGIYKNIYGVDIATDVKTIDIVW